MDGEDTLDSFVRGFKLGAGFALETFNSEQTLLKDLLKDSGE